MRNGALPSVMAFVAQASKPWSVEREAIFFTPHAPHLTACWLGTDAERHGQLRRL